MSGNSDFVIENGPMGSFAEVYAKENDIPFQPV